MQTVVIDIINSKALRILKDLELLQLIRLRRDKQQLGSNPNNDITHYKGAMSKQSFEDIEKQLHELRNEWE